MFQLRGATAKISLSVPPFNLFQLCTIFAAFHHFVLSFPSIFLMVYAPVTEYPPGRRGVIVIIIIMGHICNENHRKHKYISIHIHNIASEK